jgi:MYXO-CTERM domain-containing protein
MKKVTKVFSVIALTLVLGFATPVVAQNTGDNTSTMATANDNDDDTGKWGLAGLLGLLGLLGLKRRDDDKHRNTTTNR